MDLTNLVVIPSLSEGKLIVLFVIFLNYQEYWTESDTFNFETPTYKNCVGKELWYIINLKVTEDQI